MRHTNDAEKKLVLEAAAEYGKRAIALPFDFSVEPWQFTLEHFEAWLQWYLQRALGQVSTAMGGDAKHIKSLLEQYKTVEQRETEALAKAIPKKVEEQQPSLAEKQQTTPKQEQGISWSELLAAAEKKQLTDPQYRAVLAAAEKGGWKKRQDEPLPHMLGKMNKGTLQIRLCKAYDEAV